MKLEFKFSNMEQLKQVYDPAVVEKAARETVKQLQAKASTVISDAVRAKYSINKSEIKSALKQRLKVDANGVPTGYLVYLSPRISLRHFASSARPKIKTTQRIERKGQVKTYSVKRLGVRVKVVKTRPTRIVKGGFFGTARTSGSNQVFQRIGPWVKGGDNKIKKLTGPSISHMMRGRLPIQALNELVQNEGDAKFAHNLDHFMQKQMGLR